ncbi:hypothetical protein D3C78_1547230 [compost metagenome]
MQIESVVPYLGRIVEDAAVRGLNDLFEGQPFKLAAFQQIVQVHHVGVVMLAIMVFQSFCGNVRFEGVFFIR